jgi:hypothetical protein
MAMAYSMKSMASSIQPALAAISARHASGGTSKYHFEATLGDFMCKQLTLLIALVAYGAGSADDSTCSTVAKGPGAATTALTFKQGDREVRQARPDRGAETAEPWTVQARRPYQVQ